MKLEEWTSINKQWCTPLMLFLQLNFMILTILLISRFSNQSKKNQLGRSPSMLCTLKFINMFHFPSFNHNTCNDFSNHTQSVQFELLETNEAAGNNPASSGLAFKKFREAEAVTESELERSMDDVYSQLLERQGSPMNRTKSGTEPASGAVPVKLAKKMKKSASNTSAFRHFKEAEIVEARRRPAMVKEGKVKCGEDEEVDSKADDFISMFKQQLKLQRLDSIVRYKEMLDRGTSK